MSQAIPPSPLPCFALPTPASTAAVLEQALAALPAIGRHAATRRVLDAVQHLRTKIGASWLELLEPGLGGSCVESVARQLSYGYLPDLGTRRPGSRCSADPPQGRAADGGWAPGWITVCARIVAERIAWVPPLVLAEMAVLVAVTVPIVEQVARADALMRLVWAELPSRPQDAA